MSHRSLPNIIITGTPGVGKSSHSEILAQNTGLKNLSINEVVKSRNCHDGWDEELKSYIVDEDKLLDAIDEELIEGGCIIDWHACDLFPESVIDLIIVLRTATENLYDRLKQRDYPESKLQENIDSEIMEVLLQEARDAFDTKIVIELESDDLDDMDANVARIEAWIETWKTNNPKSLS